MKRTLISTAVIALVAGNSAMAATQATAVTDLNLRAGPGPMYKVTDVITAKDDVDVMGCHAESQWCKVTYGDETGWAYSEYLTVSAGDSSVVLTDPAARETVTKIVVEDKSDEDMIAAGTFGAAAGAVIGGPIAIAALAATGVVVSEMTAPGPHVEAYVEGHPVDTVILDGEVVVGAGIPTGVELHEIPESDYSYLTVNGQTVLVEPGDRKIVKIIR